MGAVLGSLTEIRELKTEITGLRTDLKRFIERANQQHIDTVLAGVKRNYSGLIADREVGTAKAELPGHMVQDCAMRDKCFAAFMEFLESTAQHIRDGEVTDEVILACKKEMKALQKKGTTPRCDTCFSEVSRLFEKQLGLMQALGVYAKAAGPGEVAGPVPEEPAVKEILEPIANVQRFQILQSLATQTRTFSDLSSITGLRGGNLLFHIKKLADAGMILQRHERGDYILTGKGFSTLRAICALYAALCPARDCMEARP